MVKPLSLDLRERVVAAVAGGLSRRQAAERFEDSDGFHKVHVSTMRGVVPAAFLAQAYRGAHVPLVEVILAPSPREPDISQPQYSSARISRAYAIAASNPPVKALDS